MVVAVRRALGLALAVTCLPASADFVTVITFGGANKDVQKEAFFKPFKASTGDAVVHGSYNGDLDKLKHIRGAVEHHVYSEEGTWFLRLRQEAPAEEQAMIAARYREEYGRYMGSAMV